MKGEVDVDVLHLINRCKQGDLDANATLFQQYSTKALQTVYLITGQKDIAEDIVQEAFIQCYRDIKGLRQPEAFQSWFYRLLVRVSWRVMSKEKEQVSLDNLDSNQELLSSESDILEKSVETKQLHDTLYKALGRLNMPLRTTIILHYFNGLLIKEIATVLGCREGTVKSRLHNARKQLANELKEVNWDLSHDTEVNCAKKNDEQRRKECDVSAETSKV